MVTDMYSLVENVAGIGLVIWGSALLVNKYIVKSFYDTFMDIEKNESLVYLTASAFLFVGLVTVWVHNDWYFTSTVIVTLLGWIITIKSSLWLLFPRFLSGVVKKFSWVVLNSWFRFAYGALLIVFGLLVLGQGYIEKLLSN